MSVISIDRRDRVALVTLDRSVTNALDLGLVTELGEVLCELRGDSGVAALVLGSTSEKFFSIGFDIPGLYPLAQPDFERFYRAFNQTCMTLYTLPKPSVAAVNGHAIAGGCIVALCCDYRIVAEGRTLMGLNEVKLGVPIPYLAHRVLEQVVGPRVAREVVEGGEFYPPEESLRLGLVDEVAPAGESVPRSIEWAERLGSKPGSAFEMIKRVRVEEIAAQVMIRQGEKEKEFMDCWYSESARELLREAMKKF